ncbi:MAG: hypothetical protein Q9217_001968 [Psora testacea]
MASLTLLITDLTIYIMPVPIIWSLRMTTRRKIETTVIFIIGGLYVVHHPAWLFHNRADYYSSICLIRIVQLVDTIQLDFEDVTWSNVDVAVWNIVESHIGCVAANISLMGPIFTRLGKRFKIASFLGTSSHGKSEREIRAHRNVDFGFHRLENGNVRAIHMESMTPTIDKGVADPPDAYDMDHSGPGGIMAKEDVEQNHGESC